MKTPATLALRTINALLAQAQKDVSTLVARGQDPAFKLAEIGRLTLRAAELQAA